MSVCENNLDQKPITLYFCDIYVHYINKIDDCVIQMLKFMYKFSKILPEFQLRKGYIEKRISLSFSRLYSFDDKITRELYFHSIKDKYSTTVLTTYTTQ